MTNAYNFRKALVMPAVYWTSLRMQERDYSFRSLRPARPEPRRRMLKYCVERNVAKCIPLWRCSQVTTLTKYIQNGIDG